MEQSPSSTEALDSMDLTQPAPPTEPPAKLTPKQIGQLRRQFLTQINGTVTACGHKDNFSKTDKRKGKVPSNNCINCWSAFFATSIDLDFVHTVLTTKGAKALIAIKGVKFVKMFHGFLSSQLLPALAAEIKNTLPDEAPARIEGGVFDSSSQI